MQALIQDLRFAFRQLRKSPGFTVTAVLTLALGIGATTAIFSVIHGTLQLPYPRAQQLVTVKNTYPAGAQVSVSFPDFEVWKQQTRSFSQMAALFLERKTFLGKHEPSRLAVSDVSDGFFAMFGMHPVLGRDFSPNDQKKGAASVCILAEDFWKQEFGGDTGVLGQPVVLNGKTYSVAGVVPRMVPSLFRASQIWVPLEAHPPYEQHGTNYLIAIGRLKDGTNMTRAASDLNVIQEQIDKQFPDNKHGIAIESLSQTIFGDVRPVMLILLAAVGFILLIACVNLANMLLARATDRMPEFAIRQALGAGAGRLLRQSLTESLLLAISGGVLGLLLAFSVTKIPVQAWPKFLERPDQVHLDAGVLLFTAGLVVLTDLLTGIVPALQILRQNSRAAGHAGRTVSESREQRVTRSLLMVVEIGFATLLVAAALNMAVYFARLLRTDPGINPDHLLSMTVSLSPIRYAKEAEQRRFFNTLIERLKTLPGVQSVGGISAPPFSGNAQSGDFEYDGEPSDARDKLPFAEDFFVTPGYFETVETTLLGGRSFTLQNAHGSPNVVMINRGMAEKLWPRQSAVGKRVKILGEWQQVIGVVQDVRSGGISQPAGFQVYLTTEQGTPDNMTFVLRTGVEPLTLAESVRQVVYGLDSQQPVSNIRPVDELASQSLAGERTSTALTLVLGGLALLLASIGVYGVMAYSVSRRKHEFGIRMALGSSRGGILRLLLTSAGRLVFFGVITGAVLAFPLNHWVRSLLTGTSGFSPLAFAGTSFLLAGVALLATLIPAKRAAAVEPMQALRAE